MEATTPSTTHWAPIRKDVAALRVRPNLVDYDDERAGFSWDDAHRDLSTVRSLIEYVGARD